MAFYDKYPHFVVSSVYDILPSHHYFLRYLEQQKLFSDRRDATRSLTLTFSSPLCPESSITIEISIFAAVGRFQRFRVLNASCIPLELLS